jgi:hypothetical protein
MRHFWHSLKVLMERRARGFDAPAFFLCMTCHPTEMRVSETNMKASGLLARFSAIHAKNNAIENIARIVVVGVLLYSPTALMCNAAEQTATSLPRADLFVPREVLRLDWGPGDHQVGLLQVFGGNYGPQSFAVDEAQQQFYILDSTNSRIKIYDLNGALVSAVSISETADDIALAPDGDILVLYRAGKRVVRYDPSGLQRYVYPLPDTKSPIMRLHFSRDSGPALETADQRSLVLTTGEAASAQATESAGTDATGLKRGGSSFHLERSTSGEGALHIHDITRGTQRTLHIKSDGQRIVTLTLIGIDRDGNIYITVEESGESSSVKRYIKKYNSQGGLLAEAVIPFSAYVFTSQDLRVTEAGTIYQLLALKAGVEVLEWKIGELTDAAAPEFVDRLFSSSVVHNGEFIPGDIPESATMERTPLSTSQLVQALPQAAIVASDVMSRAEAYEKHQYNVLSMNIAGGSGLQCGGKTIQTNILSPGLYTGVAYKWGGFSGLTGVTSVVEPGTGFNFDEGLAEGKYAGDKNTNTSFGSGCAVGVDCSGFVSQVWGLAAKQSTSTLPGVSCCLNSSCTGASAPYYPSYMLPGDILNSASSSGGVGHVRLVSARNADGTFSVYESSARTWNVATYAYTASQLSSNYYYPFRGREVANSLQAGATIQTSSDVNVRSCPSSSCGAICTAPAGSIGTLAGTSQDSDGFLWWEVQWTNGCVSGTAGWSIGCYLQPFSGSTQPPTLSSFDVSPKTVTSGSRLTASLAGTKGGNPLSSVSLLRTSDTTGSGGWTTISQTAVSGDSVSVTLYDTPVSPGKYLYGARITDSVGLFAKEQAPIQIAVMTAPTVKVSPGVNTITPLQSVSVTVTVSGAKGSPTPTGNVSLLCGGFSGTGALRNGKTVITIPGTTFSSAGNYPVTASYPGDSNYGSATGTSSITVKRPR